MRRHHAFSSRARRWREAVSRTGRAAGSSKEVASAGSMNSAPPICCIDTLDAAAEGDTLPFDGEAMCGCMRNASCSPMSEMELSLRTDPSSATEGDCRDGLESEEVEPGETEWKRRSGREPSTLKI